LHHYVDIPAVEAAAEAEWNNAAVRAEFRGNREAFIAYRRAEGRGLVGARLSARKTQAPSQAPAMVPAKASVFSGAHAGAPSAASSTTEALGFLVCASGTGTIDFDPNWPEWRKQQARVIAARFPSAWTEAQKQQAQERARWHAAREAARRAALARSAEVGNV
jgi:hypothetical protein